LTGEGSPFESLVREAVEARKRAYAPYSGFLVGAALLDSNGSVYAGCNIENAAFSPTVCAERVAIFKAVSDGRRELKAIAVAGWREGANSFAFPCGLCRQVMREFCNPDTFVILITDGKDVIKRTLGQLLPDGFGPDNIKEEIK